MPAGLPAAPCRLPQWVTVWVVVSSFLVAIDCLYVLALEGGRLHMLPKVLAALRSGAVSSWFGPS